jgi:hypothetical protein
MCMPAHQGMYRGVWTGTRSYACLAGTGPVQQRHHARSIRTTPGSLLPAKKRNFVLVSCKLHIPEDVLTGCLERDAIGNTASLEHPHLQGNNPGTEHNPVVHVVDACGLDR